VVELHRYLPGTTPGGAARHSATDGALIERRREEIEGSVPALELMFDIEVLDVSPRLNPPPCEPEQS
jgi:hypothetical protein